jgi:hypothetical protein
MPASNLFPVAVLALPFERCLMTFVRKGNIIFHLENFRVIHRICGDGNEEDGKKESFHITAPFGWDRFFFRTGGAQPPV